MAALIGAVPILSRYSLYPSLQQGFIDKDTGELLAFGKITFYRNVDRTNPGGLKPIFKISGTPDDPVFVELQNPMILSAIGTMFDDNDNEDIIPYYYPYDANGNPDPYYIVVTSAPKPGFPDGVEQFTRIYYPGVIDNSGDNIITAQNFIPNGQFLDHQNIDETTGAVVDAITPIAWGGWSLILDNGFTSTNFLTFERYDNPIETPEANPRFALRFKCTSPNPAETRKDITLTIDDVNYGQGQALTFQFAATSNIGVPVSADFIILKNFGTGGSTQTETVVQTITIGITDANYLVNFTMSSNTGKILGTQDDDYLQFILRPSTSAATDFSMTDVMGADGTFAALIYPATTPEQTNAFAIPASLDIPDPNGADINKCLQLSLSSARGLKNLRVQYIATPPTGSGMEWWGPIANPAPLGWLYQNGAAYAVQDAISIPVYSDLFGVMGYACGTGQDGFRNASVMAGQMSHTWNRNDVVQPAPDSGTSGFTITIHTPGTVGVYQVVYVSPINASLIVPGSYYRLLVNTGGPQFIQLFWFTVDGVGTKPTGVTHDVAVRIDLLGTDAAAAVATKLISFANGLFQVPNAQALFKRGTANGSTNDPDRNSRTASGFAGSGNTGDKVGTFQQDEFQSHDHPGSVVNWSNEAIQSGGGTVPNVNGSGNTSGITIAPEGGNETRPINIGCNYIIKT